MRFRVSIAVMAVALALPVYAQHGGRGGFSGHSGISGHAGFTGHPGFSGSSGFSRLSPPMGNGGLARPGFGRFTPPAGSGFRVPYQSRGFINRGFAQNRPAYRSGSGYNHGRNRGHYHNGWYRPWFAYNYGYPGYLGYPYPYVIDPGFYNWGDPGGYDDNAQGSASSYPDSPPYTDYGPEPDAPQEPEYRQAPAPPAPTARQPYAGSISATPAVSQPLTVIFKNGRAPETMQNYMMNSRTLTNLDQNHYEQIPLGQIDMAATEQTNRARGVNFQAPIASRD